MSDLIKALQLAMEIAEKAAVEAPAVVQAVEEVAHPTDTPVAIPPEQEAAAQVTPIATPNPPETAVAPAGDTFDKVASTVGEVATVVGLIPGLQASHLVALLTHVTALVNVAEQIKVAVQQNAPGEWAQIESVFSSAVGAFHSIPKA